MKNKDEIEPEIPLEFEAIWKETELELLRKIVSTLALKDNEISEMVELFYDSQGLRIAHANRERTEPPSLLAQWFQKWCLAGEKVISHALKKWILSDESPAETKWAYDQIGIGPVLAAGLAAHIDVTKARTISAVWKFAGQAPGFDRRVKGTTLPYNARLKVLCYKISDSFVKVSGNQKSFYGRLYSEFKKEEVQKNESGLLKGAAQRELTSKKITKPEVRLKNEQGRLTDGHVDNRARRRVVKIFLSHYWLRGREARGLPVPGPYSGDILGHSGMI